ncbi:MAG: ABC transporter permease [Casimicrobiaceae bacterium]|nr:ABC transporter permease [Casimicrobiaceae bacterium]MCX8097961.1 ABC transporter permease [Casimicrobiaceae bacterium]MDW8313046.1 FtsX-like permease family protein [Burkholderiales bacterium]
MLLRLILRNLLRARLRTALTFAGLTIAVVAFGLLRTVVDAWYAGANMASANRLITRNAISLTFTLPITYRERIRALDGVTGVAMSTWFGGIYQEPRNFFPQFAVSVREYFALFPEFIVPEEQMRAMLADRRGALVGRRLAEQYGWKIGDTVPLKGTIYPGRWEFTIRGIYDGRDETTLTRQFYFHWEYLNETMRVRLPRVAERTGVFVVGIRDGQRAAEIAQAIDREFANSLAETLTETEKAFQLGFVAQSETIVQAIRLVSFVVIAIILAVVANTMAMSARERLREYATLKALGFSPRFVALLIFGESLVLTTAGALAGIALTLPVLDLFRDAVSTAFPVVRLTVETMLGQALAMLVVGVLAAVLPALRSARVRIVDGLRHVG